MSFDIKLYRIQKGCQHGETLVNVFIIDWHFCYLYLTVLQDPGMNCVSTNVLVKVAEGMNMYMPNRCHLHIFLFFLLVSPGTPRILKFKHDIKKQVLLEEIIKWTLLSTFRSWKCNHEEKDKWYCQTHLIFFFSHITKRQFKYYPINACNYIITGSN